MVKLLNTFKVWQLRIYPNMNFVLLLEDTGSKSSSLSRTGRRSKLPVPMSSTAGVNLWNLLCKNIGKDLSKISMPVTLNEPLSVLQRYFINPYGRFKCVDYILSFKNSFKVICTLKNFSTTAQFLGQAVRRAWVLGVTWSCGKIKRSTRKNASCICVCCIILCVGCKCFQSSP